MDMSPLVADETFSDVLAANAAYAEDFQHKGLAPVAGRGLAVVTCMDSRIEPLTMLGLRPGEAKIIRNAGARVTDEVLGTLVLAAHLLGVTRVMVVAHTSCKMSSASAEEVFQAIEHSGVDARSLDFAMVEDQERALNRDIERIRHWPFLPRSLVAAGFVYDVDNGRVKHIC